MDLFTVFLPVSIEVQENGSYPASFSAPWRRIHGVMLKAEADAIDLYVSFVRPSVRWSVCLHACACIVKCAPKVMKDFYMMVPLH